jgi:hypothetical protein
MGLVLITGFSIPVMASCASDAIVAGSFKRVISCTSKINPVVGLIVRSLSATTSNRSSSIRRMHCNQAVIIRVTSLAGIG